MMEERLKFIFSNVNEFLRFAEAKNAMIIAFNAGSIYGISQTYALEIVKSWEFMKVYMTISIVLLVFSTIISLLSFVPKLKIIKKGFFSEDASNVLFFEYLKNKTSAEILKEVNDLKEESYSTFEKDIAEQIKQNSLIASRKYSYFTIAVWLTIAAYITFPLAGIFCYNVYKD